MIKRTPSQSDSSKSNSYLLRYAGLTMQILVSLGIAVFLGIKADEWLKLSFPILTWVLPLLVITGIIVKMIKDTSRKNK